MTNQERAAKYVANMSLSELKDYEDSLSSYNGADKGDYLAMIQKRRDEITNAEQAQKEARAARVYHLEKLDPYKNLPRNDDQFVADVAGKAPFFGKDKWKKSHLNAPIVYGKIVQANSALWDSGSGKDLAAVVVFALDPQHMYNEDWLIEIADKISELKHSNSVPKDCSELIKNLRNSQSYFCFQVGESIAQTADAWCGTYSFANQADLPYSALPGNGIVPFLLMEAPKKNQFLQLKTIPGKYYN